MFKDSLKKVQNINRIFNRSWLVSSIVTFGILAIYLLNGQTTDNNSSINQVQGQSSKKIGLNCAVTQTQFLEKLDTSDLNTIFQIATIDTATELIDTKLTKNQVAAITHPVFTSYQEMDGCLDDSEQVVVVKKQDKVKLYPQRILTFHLAVNDTIKGLPIVVTRCNLCDSYAVYQREYRNQQLQLYVSGLLYKNNDMLFDQGTESLWSQFDGQARVGSLTGAKLQPYKYQILSYQQARLAYPQAQILSFDTGFRYNYNNADYNSFYQDDSVMGPVTNLSDDLRLKEPILGFELQGQYYAVPLSSLTERTFTAKVENTDIFITNTSKGYQHSANIRQLIPVRWYVWYDFYPETVLLK